MVPAPSSRRIALVTGASSGIGAATARRLAAEGFLVHCAARRTDRIETLADEIGGVATACDVTDRASVAALAARVGPVLHVLVNNAGGAFGADTVEGSDPDDWARAYDVNVLGTLHVTQALLPALRAGGEGLVVNLGSTAGRVVYEGGGSYTASKHALKALTGTLRLELSGEPIRVTEVAPGMVRTDEFSLKRFGGDAAKADAVYAGVPEPLTADDIADVVGWVATRPAQGAPGHLTAQVSGRLRFVQTIGLVGGMSWESSAVYYRDLNVGVQERLGGLSSPRLVLSTVDFAELTDLEEGERWDQIGELLADAGRGVERAGADFLLLCTTTFHKVADQVEAAVDIPLLHLADVVAEACLAQGATTVGFIGTKVAMEDTFFAERLG